MFVDTPQQWCSWDMAGSALGIHGGSCNLMTALRGGGFRAKRRFQLNHRPTGLGWGLPRLGEPGDPG